MIPNMSIYEQLMRERAQRWQHVREQQHLLTPLQKPHTVLCATCFVPLGTRMKQLEWRREVYDQ
jgi:hypothetical protein